MEEENKINGEDLNFNNENLNSEGAEQAKTVFTLEEVEAMKKEMQSNSDKGVQKVISEKKVYEQSLKELSKIADNPERLIELYEENPLIAKTILNDFYDGETIESYIDRIGYKEDYTDPKILEKKIKQEAEKITKTNQISSEKKQFITRLQMTDEEVKAFEETFNELREVKSFASKDLTKQFEKAYRLAIDNEDSIKKLNNSEVIARASAIGESKTGGKKEVNQLQNEMANFLKIHKII